MPVVKPISDLQRDFGSIADSCHKTKDPVYLTKTDRHRLPLWIQRPMTVRHAH